MLKLLVIGNLGKDAEVRQTQGGNSVINFSVAHTERYTDKQGNKAQKTTWVECSWWTDKHAIVPFLKKGTQVYIEGMPEVKTFERQDGTTAANIGLRVLSVQLLGGGSNSNGQTQQATQEAPKQQEDFKSQAPAMNEDLPF